jgi:hypothetical protein
VSTHAQRRALETYWERIARIFGIEGWVLTVDDASPPDDSEAATFLVNNENTARLHVPEAFWSRTPESQRILVAHEALHLLFDRPLIDFRAAVEKVVPQYLADALEEQAVRQQERAIEQLARSVAHNLPMPKLPGAPKPVAVVATDT